MAKNLVFEMDYDMEPARAESGEVVFSLRNRPLMKFWTDEYTPGIGYYVFAIQIFDDFIGSGHRIMREILFL